MKNKHLKVSLNIVAVFVVVMLVSFIPDQFPKFFGDWQCEGRSYSYVDVGNGRFDYKTIGCDHGVNNHLPSWHWGYRHWLFIIMGLLLFVVQVIRIGGIINEDEEK